LPKWPENCFEPFGKGGWPSISTWINTTIKQFTESTTSYPIGAIGAVVTAAKKVGMQYILHIKDGNSENDKATIELLLNKIT
jgi:hypothetical protein